MKNGISAKKDSPSHIVMTIILILISTLLIYLLEVFFPYGTANRESLNWILLGIYPGVAFSVVVLICNKQISLINQIYFVIVASFFNFGVLFFSLSSWGLGAFVLPSLGSIILLKMQNEVFGVEYSQKAIRLSALSGPISGALVFSILVVSGSFSDVIYAVLITPIFAWWLFMAAIMDNFSTQKKENV